MLSDKYDSCDRGLNRAHCTGFNRNLIDKSILHAAGKLINVYAEEVIVNGYKRQNMMTILTNLLNNIIEIKVPYVHARLTSFERQNHPS